MTDQTAPDVTDDDRRIARDWAEHIINTPGTSLPMEAAAARVILNTVPAPPRPTLADMTAQERFNAVGMWADVDGFHPYRAVIDDIPAPKVPVFKPTAGSLGWAHPEDVTPLPELGRAWSPGGSPIGIPDAVPPSTLAVGSEWNDADALARACEESGRDQIVITDKDGDVFVWGADAEWWEAGLPERSYAPFTILHAGKGADQ